jgi:endonuclease/exonuclease/phosphatase family metal-dependent hydrolase
VTGTYGTAILSKYPLKNTRSVFTFSNVDEVGTSVAEITFKDKQICVVCAHPCGNDYSDKAFTDTLLQTVSEYDYVIAMGDYNMRETEAYYSQIVKVLNDSWKNFIV